MQVPVGASSTYEGRIDLFNLVKNKRGSFFGLSRVLLHGSQIIEIDLNKMSVTTKIQIQ